MPHFLLLGEDVQRDVLLHLDVAALCAVRRAIKSLGPLIAHVDFQKAWLTWQKTLSIDGQRRILRCLQAEDVLTSTDLPAAAAILAALHMIKIADADEPLHYCKHIKRIGQDKDCWCAMVGFEFGEWIPFHWQRGPKDRVAVASWTTSHYEHDESGEVVSNVGMHVYNPHLVACMQEVCRVANETSVDFIPVSAVMHRPDSEFSGAQTLRRALLGECPAAEELTVPKLLTIMLCAGAAWLNIGASAAHPVDDWDEDIRARATHLHAALANPEEDTAYAKRVLNVTVHAGTSEFRPTDEYQLYGGMFLDEWKQTEDGTREGNRWPGDRRVHRAGPVEAAMERFMQGKFGLLPNREVSVYEQAVYGAAV